MGKSEKNKKNMDRMKDTKLETNLPWVRFFSVLKFFK